MQNSFYEGFEKNWDKFRSRLQGKIMVQINKGVFNLPSLNLALADCIEFWDSRHSEGGRWLDELEKALPDKANMVREILLKDMRFAEESDGGTQNNFLQYAVPAGSAIVGFSLAKVMGATEVIRAVCTIVPAAVAFPLTKNIISMADCNKKKEMIKNYLAQLEKYRLSIESILKDI